MRFTLRKALLTPLRIPAIGALLVFAVDATAQSQVSTARDGWDFNLSAAQLTSLCDSTIAGARAAFAELENDSEPATVERVFGRYDAIVIDLQAIRHIWYLKSVHPDTAIQAAAEACIRQYSDFDVQQSLSQKFYQRVAAIELDQASAAQRLMVANRLRDFRQAGVDRGPATLAKVRALLDEITRLGTEFDRNIREDSRYVDASPAGLRGLPDDFLAGHRADERGLIRISTDYPDYFPVMKYAQDDNLRRRLYITSKSIATPGNGEVLWALIEKRQALATLLNYDSYAALAMDGLMIGSPERARAFLGELGAAVKAPAARNLKTLLGRLRRIDPGASRVEVWQQSYLSNLIRQEEYAVDAREVREYFHFDKVRAGIFQLVENLFGVEIVPWRTSTWHPDVTAWEIRDQGLPVGRFYLDMHPRDNKYKHAAHWTLRTGLRDRQLPISGMATNFPRGLMEHAQVETFLHEFGHLLHNMFSGTQDWMDISGMAMERDFVEAPSQMLEEWVWDYDTLRRFASNDAGEPIPRTLVSRMNRARHFGQGIFTAQQLFIAELALEYYSRDPASFELLPLLRELQARYSPFPYVEGTHFYNSFGHLYGYASNYYMYQWSLAIATDLFRQFETKGLHSTELASRYRRTVLAAAGSKPAREFIADFLGRPFSTSAYTEYLKTLD